MGQKIIVIGSGFGGLGAAARLAAKGHDVTLFEKRDKLGGRAYTYAIDGFKFDGGPTVITAPWLLDEIWEMAGKRRADYFELTPIDPFYKIFDHAGRGFSYNGDHEYILSQIEQWNPRDKDGYTRFMATTKEIFDTGMALIDKPFLHFGDMLRVAPDLVRLQSYRSVFAPLFLLSPAVDRWQPARCPVALRPHPLPGAAMGYPLRQRGYRRHRRCVWPPAARVRRESASQHGDSGDRD
jgi:phytoene desaturase